VLRVTVSVGAAIVDDGVDPGRLVANADAALYRAKRAGKNRVELHGRPHHKDTP
jgi:two-component system cell cycle response regulator